ncbi:MAG: hypothetical protein DCF25_16480 [Leptolyngbya foveolarum]|uniref:Uncharacterized protein n=1 Tax=Leptolyngbya foveolarum TaxID=47253 RepID=A0A2W4VTT8_9CYAN|nr:MAG: hypothetical protein DCF25_16480 [Leptolyngbya foveolarum]
MSKFLKGLLILMGVGFVSLPLLIWATAPKGSVSDVAIAPVSVPISQVDPITDYQAGLSAVPSMAAFVADVRLGLIDGLVEIEVTPQFQAEAKADREGLAVVLWEAWTRSYGGDDVDNARIRLVDEQGRQVGGSRAIAGSVIYVDD